MIDPAKQNDGADPPEARLEAAAALAAAGDKTRALQAYLEVGLHYLYDAGDMPKARAAFAAAHQLDASNLDVIFQMGQADVVEGRTQDALAKFIDVLRKSNLKHVPALFEAGCIYQSTGQYDQAILAFKKVLDRDKNHVQAIVHMGQLHQTKGMVPESLGYYMQAAEIARENKQFGTAQQLLNMVMALDGGNQKARIMLDDLAEHAREEEADELPATPPGPDAVAPAAAASANAAEQSPAVSAEIAASIAEAARKLDALGGERDDLRRQIEALTAARLEMEQTVARTNDEIETAAAARDLAEAAREDVERELSVLSQTLEREKAALAESEKQKAALAAEIAAQSGTLADAKREHVSVSGSAEKRRAELEMQLADLAAKRSEAEAAVAQAQASIRAGQDQQTKAQADAAKALEKMKAEIAAFEAQRSAAQAAAKEAEATAAKSAEAAKSDIATLEAKRAAAQAAAEEAEATAAKSAQAAKDEIASLEARRSAAAEAAKEAKAAADAAAALKAKSESDAAAARDQTASLAKTKKAEETAAARAAASLEELRSSIAALEKQRAEVGAQSEAAVKQRDALRAEASAAESTLESLRERVKSAGAHAADAEKLKKVSAQAKEADASLQAAKAQLAQTTSAVEALEARKREIDDAYAKSKSLAAAADDKRAEATRAAEQAEVLRAKREADAEALAARLAGLEAALKDAEGKAQIAAAEGAALQDVSGKVTAQRHTLLEIEGRKAALEDEAAQADKRLESLRAEIAQAQAALEEARASAAAVPAVPSGPRPPDDAVAEAVAASVAPEACAESLRAIEQLAAEGALPFETAAELAGLIHEGRAVEALRVCRAHANLEAAPGPYLLAVGDLSRDLGDAAGARDAYRMLAAADPSKVAVSRQRIGQLFLTFADQSTAAALARDDAHFASAQDPAKALPAYADLVARFPHDPFFRQELGEIHERLGNAEAAGLAFTQAMVEYLGIDDFAKAVELAPKLLAARPDSGQALELAARALDRAGRARDAQSKLDEALHAYRRAKSAADVERVCRRLAEIADDPVPYRRELASLLQEVGDAPGAAEQLLEGAERLVKWSNAGDALSLIKEAGVLSAGDEALEERVSAAKEKALQAQLSVDFATRAAMFLSKKEFEKAAEAYRSAVDNNPYNADACFQLAGLLTDRFPDYPTAEQLLENAAELRPGHTATRYRLALVKAARGDVEQAVELLVALARFDENNADFIDQFVERLEKDADSGAAAAKYRLGIAYRELGRLEEALVILQSIQREPEFIVLCLNAIGLCLRRQGLDTAAAKRFQKAIETPGYPETQYNEALYNLGDLYETKHDPESLALSLSSFEELYARDCTYRDVTDRIKSVKAKIGAAEGPKVKRLPNRSEAVNDR